MALDVVIAGGGPAGTMTALGLARRGYRVLLAERTQYDAWRPGEALPAEIQRPLLQLGLWPRFLSLRPRPSLAVLSAWGGSTLAVQWQGQGAHENGWHVDRRGFDALLAEAAEAEGALVRRGTHVQQIERRESGFQVVLTGNAGQQGVSARCLVDATGRGGQVARRLGGTRLCHDRLVGLLGVLSPRPDAELDALLLEPVAEGWWYSAPLPDGRLLLALMTDSDLLARGRRALAGWWTGRLQQTVYSRPRARGRVPASDLCVRSAATSHLMQPAGPGWLAVGDAAFACDPLSARGIYQALLSGQSAAEALDAYLQGQGDALDAYARQIINEVEPYLAERRHYYGLEGRWPDAPFWRRRHAQANWQKGAAAEQSAALGGRHSADR